MNRSFLILLLCLLSRPVLWADLIVTVSPEAGGSQTRVHFNGALALDESAWSNSTGGGGSDRRIISNTRRGAKLGFSDRTIASAFSFNFSWSAAFVGDDTTHLIPGMLSGALNSGSLVSDQGYGPSFSWNQGRGATTMFLFANGHDVGGALASWTNKSATFDFDYNTFLNLPWEGETANFGGAAGDGIKFSVVAASVPEPSAFVLGAFPVLALLGRRRRKAVL